MYDNDDAGPTGVFTGAMATTVTRRAKSIIILANAVFANLVFMFPTGETQEVAASSVASYPALIELNDVKSFKLTSGTILVRFYYAVGDPFH